MLIHAHVLVYSAYVCMHLIFCFQFFLGKLAYIFKNEGKVQLYDDKVTLDAFGLRDRINSRECLTCLRM